MNELEISTEPSNQETVSFVSRWAYRTPEQKRIDAEKALSRAWPARPLAEGMTLDDAVCGIWPGDETDEQITEALRKLS